MTRKKIIDEDLENKILNILENENRGMSIKQIKERLERDYNISRSPQIVLRHLQSLKSKKKIYEENGKKI
jgi:intein-encoded DNA endonuclease-like protein